MCEEYGVIVLTYNPMAINIGPLWTNTCIGPS